MDERTWDVMSTFREFMEEALSDARARADEDGPSIARRVEEFLGVSPSQLPVIKLTIPSHQFVNLDVAVAALVERHGGGHLIGIGGGDQRHHQDLGDLLQSHRGWGGPTVGAVDRAREETGPSSSREVVTMGIHLFRYDGTPVAMLQRRSRPQYDSSSGVEVVAAGEVTEALLSDIRALMIELSVFRGQVLGFGLRDEMYGHSTGGIAFLQRPELTANQVVLPAGALARVERHVAGAERHRELLLAAGQHLKRGLLIYGPPGTGKTHTVRYLLGQLPDVTAVVLTGNALGLISDATELAQALQPALVVLEDVDLIAQSRDMYEGPQPLLFALLDSMDGLAADADVGFVLTTNRADLLEPALSQRPGRVDLAVEVPLPDRESRRALLALYAGNLGLSDPALDVAADRTDGMTASFFKELARRIVLTAADSGADTDDSLLQSTLQEMLGEGERLTRALLGSAPRSL